MSMRLFFLVVVIALSSQAPAFAQKKVDMKVKLRLLSQHTALPESAPSTKLVYIDYSGHPSVERSTWRDWGRKYSFLELAEEQSTLPEYETVSHLQKFVDENENALNLKEAIQRNVAADLSQKGIRVSDNSKTYFGVMPVKSEFITRKFVNIVQTDGKVEFLVIAGNLGDPPSFSKRYPCKVKTDAAVARAGIRKAFEQCYQRTIKTVFKEKKLRKITGFSK